MEPEASQLRSPELPKASPLNAREEDALCLLQRRQLFTQDKWSMSCCRWGN